MVSSQSTLLLLLSIAECFFTSTTHIDTVEAFTPSFFPSSSSRCLWPSLQTSCRISRQCRYQYPLYGRPDDDDGDKEEEAENPYADPNFPDLEFVNYDDPNYQVDQGTGDEFWDPTREATREAVEKEVEEMREDRRRRNDEFQFQTYFRDILKNGDEYKGEWTVYKTSTFLDGVPDLDTIDNGNIVVPRLVQSPDILKVISGGHKIEVSTDSPYPVDAERIVHEQRIALAEDFDESPSEASPLSPEAIEMGSEIISNIYWPDPLAASDFRGQQGIMNVGASYTLATAVPLEPSSSSTTPTLGPFAEYRAELGLQSKDLRFRVKFDYSVLEEEKKSDTPPLLLKSLTVCRETRNTWPRSSTADETYKSSVSRNAEEALFGKAGAEGGLYDPPPIAGGDAQAACYMMLDLEGHATVLFPYRLDQNPDAFDGSGWVTSLDWTPGALRYQADRKVNGGAALLGLRTLELSEVQNVDAETYRPRDGGQDMRQ